MPKTFSPKRTRLHQWQNPWFSLHFNTTGGTVHECMHATFTPVYLKTYIITANRKPPESILASVSLKKVTYCKLAASLE